jgi:hypothetical protein
MSRVLDFQDGFDSSVEPTSVDFPASAVSVTPAGNLASTDAQSALEELQADVDTRATASDLALKANINSPTFTGTVSGITASMVGLGNVDNTSDATKNAAAAILTNKDIDGGTASNTSRITVPKATKATLDALTRKEATIVYGTDTAKAYVDNGSALVPIGSGSGGGINYITNPDAENDTSGWAAYADAAGTTPVDGTGGSPSSTFTRTTSSPLASTASFLWTKSGSASRQGEGFSYDFTIDAAYKGQQLALNALFEVTSGTFATGDMVWYIRDLTNSVNIQPSGYQLVSTGIAGPIQPVVFQAASNSTSYRLICHTATTSTQNYTLKFDNFSVGPQVVPVGAAMSDWVSYTPTLTTSGGGSVTLNATSQVAPWGRWRRVGDSIEISGGFRNGTGGAASGTAGNAKFSFPSGIAVDAVNRSAASDGILGAYLGPAYISTGSTAVAAYDVYSDSTLSWGDTGSSIVSVSDIAAGYSLSFRAKFKVAGWSSNVLTSDSAATRVVAASILGNPNSSITSSYSDVTWAAGSMTIDTHGAFTRTTGSFLVPVPGYYKCSANFELARTSGSVTQYGVSAIKNVTKSQTIPLGRDSWVSSGSEGIGFSGSALIYADAGDTLRFLVASQGTGAAWSSAVAGNFVSIEQVQGPAQIQAATNVGCTYTGTASTTGTNGVNNVVAFSTKVKDTHGAYNTSTGAYTCPAPGDYEMVAHIAVTLTPAAAANGCYIVGMKNSTSTATVQTGVASINTTAQAAFLRLAFVFRDCVAGDSLYVGINNGWNTTNNVALNTSGVLTNMSIQRLSGVN